MKDKLLDLFGKSVWLILGLIGIVTFIIMLPFIIIALVLDNIN